MGESSKLKFQAIKVVLEGHTKLPFQKKIKFHVGGGGGGGGGGWKSEFVRGLMEGWEVLKFQKIS